MNNPVYIFQIAYGLTHTSDVLDSNLWTYESDFSFTLTQGVLNQLKELTLQAGFLNNKDGFQVKVPLS
jgi:hypothetical protein